MDRGGGIHCTVGNICSIRIPSHNAKINVILLSLDLTLGPVRNRAIVDKDGHYRRTVCRLLYLGFTRPDISFVVQQLSQFLQYPRSSHWDVAMHVLSYLKGSPSLGICFPFHKFRISLLIWMRAGVRIVILTAPSLVTASSLGRLLFPGN
ncbi:Retrovirus-related Pol polyprotein from transposon RE2 [Sesamum angolense]|uniref:Retrovirus-related Pol polyprotein from transposon RE2 n=1 Tax=Sesamum angolense TaxID=2727404 RepID=A0AAE1WBX1_9LAMI|nr:Retrovirus-related Pol polyprotein from transposon RE2 [Sesamum angolense]